ncbi:3927_t:CDS:10 [Cetraspora pellucida]|uniref:3927_t:CDS:1 n=1 Tax=Cetraspora pellucida TaxID=1433469 RepID=A0A9N9G3C4_9GLOM|nr:3927_t:CDS:10 [Cetraspora pellucida]
MAKQMQVSASQTIELVRQSRGSLPSLQTEEAKSNSTYRYFTPLIPSKSQYASSDLDNNKDEEDGYNKKENKLHAPSYPEKISKSDEWFLSLQYLHCNINNLLITNSFLDSMSKFGGGNSKHIFKSLRWYTDMPISVKDKDAKIVTATGNFACINNDKPEPMLCLGITWIRKVQGIFDPNKNQFQMKLYRKTYTIPTFSKATEVNEPKQQVSDMYDSENLKKNMTYLKSKDGHIEANLSASFINFSRSAFLLDVSNKVCAHCGSLNLSLEEITHKDISLKESKIKRKDLLSKIKILETKLSSTQNKSKKITALQFMKKILESKLESAQKDAFLTQKEIKTKNILDPVIREGTEKNTQNKEQSFISNSGDTSEKSEIQGYASSKSLAKYFKKSLIQDITIEGTVCADKALVNDNNIFHQTSPSRFLNSKPDYTHYITASGNLFSEIYKPTMNKQNKMNYQKKEIVYPIYKNHNIDKANKHVASHCQSHLASPTWPFRMIVTEKSGSDGRRYISCDDLIVCGYHSDKPKWVFVRYIYGIISKDPKASYYENI